MAVFMIKRVLVKTIGIIVFSVLSSIDLLVLTLLIVELQIAELERFSHDTVL